MIRQFLYSYPIVLLIYNYLAGYLSVFYFSSLTVIAISFVICLLLRCRFLEIALMLTFLILGMLYGHYYKKDNDYKKNFNSKNELYQGFVEVLTFPSSRGSIRVKTQVIDEPSTELLLRSDNDFTTVPGDILYIHMNLDTFEKTQYDWQPNFKFIYENQGVMGTGFLKKEELVLVGNASNQTLFSKLNEIRSNGIQKLKKSYSSDDAFAISSAFVFGDKTALHHTLRQKYVDTGIAHILAVSGFHIGLYCFILLYFINRIPNNTSETRIAKLLFLIIVLGLLVIITGSSTSSIRAAIMFILYFGSKLLAPSRDGLNVILFAAMCMLLYNPRWVFDVGFQLSFMAVLGINLYFGRLRSFYKTVNQPRLWMLDALAISLCAHLFTLPLQIFYFHQTNANFWVLSVPVVLFSVSVVSANLLMILFYGSQFQNNLSQIFEWSISEFHKFLDWMRTFEVLIYKDIWWQWEMVFVTYSVLFIFIIPKKIIGFKLLSILTLSIFFLILLKKDHSEKQWQVHLIRTHSEHSLHIIYKGVDYYRTVVDGSDYNKGIMRSKYRVTEIYDLSQCSMLDAPFLKMYKNYILVENKIFKFTEDDIVQL